MKQLILYLFVAGVYCFLFSSCDKKEKELAEQQRIADSVALAQKEFNENIIGFSSEPSLFLEEYFYKGKIRPLGDFSLQTLYAGEKFSYSKKGVTYTGTLVNPVNLILWNGSYYDKSGAVFQKHEFKILPKGIFNFLIKEIPEKLSSEWLDQVLLFWPLSLRIHYSTMSSCLIVENYEIYLLLNRADKDIDYFELSESNPSRIVQIDNSAPLLLLNEDGSIYLKRK